jgi:3-isopropylmalate dehydrogenase
MCTIVYISVHDDRATVQRPGNQRTGRKILSSRTQEKLRIALLPGDGIGPEITASTAEVLREVNEMLDLGIAFETHDIGLKTIETHGSAYPDHVHEACQKVDAAVLGPGGRALYPRGNIGGIAASGEMRKRFDLFANIRPARTREGVRAPCGKAFDMVVVRENTEGFYSDRNMFMGGGEFMPTPDVALAVRKVTRSASMRIAEVAFAIARSRAKKLTVVTKSNVLQYSEGLFMECVRTVGKDFPDVEIEEKFIDAMTALLVRTPEAFDVIVTTNMFGDILTDLSSELSGSIGLGASLNSGTNYAIAQAQHGSAPDIAGKDLANPISLVSSAAMLLAWLGDRRGEPRLNQAAALIDRAVDAALADPQRRTRDLGGTLGTKAFTDVLLAQLHQSNRGTEAA